LRPRFIFCFFPAIPALGAQESMQGGVSVASLLISLFLAQGSQYELVGRRENRTV
jgi:hypothetical protein